MNHVHIILTASKQTFGSALGALPHTHDLAVRLGWRMRLCAVGCTATGDQSTPITGSIKMNLNS